eukprot:SAG22_NODE_33_length_27588_cov_104.174652_1_plen_1765_part_00
MTQIAVWGQKGHAPGWVFHGSGLAPQAFVGARGVRSGVDFSSEQYDSHGNFRGTIAMLQIYGSAVSDVGCIFEAGQQLVQSGHLGLESSCQAQTVVPCSSLAASNGPASSDESEATRDGGACEFQSGSSESGIVEVTTTWQTVHFSSSYTRPLVFCGALTRSSTAQAIVRLRNVASDHFEVRLEQKLCHRIPATTLAERASYLVVEAGLAADDGWQASALRVRDEEWHRISYLSPFDSAPVVLTQVQNFDTRIDLVTVRQHLVPGPNLASTHFSFFQQVQGDGIFCPDGHFFAEYYDNVDLSGSPIATQCESTAPDWEWHDEAPAAMGSAGTSLFSARFSARWSLPSQQSIVFSSFTSGGSRVILYRDVLDGHPVVVIDRWEECCSTFSSQPVLMEPGYHFVIFEFRVMTRDATPTLMLGDDSFAHLSWSGADVTEHDTGQHDPVFVDVGWFAVVGGIGSIQGTAFAAGYFHFAPGESDLAVNISFAESFGSAPIVFAGYHSIDVAEGGHLRLEACDLTAAHLALEFDSCEIPPAWMEGNGRVVGWLAMASSGASATVLQQPTHPTDVAALLKMAAKVSLPAYLRWQKGSDPCLDRWVGIECRVPTSTDSGQELRVVTLDIHDVDMTGNELPWDAIGDLDHLEELSLWSCGFGGQISAALCGLVTLQVLVLSQNNIQGTIPDCMCEMVSINWLWLESNDLHGPLSVYGPLGKFLKNVDSPNLNENRWASILPSEKAVLEQVAPPLGIAEHERDWNFDYRYEWALTDAAPAMHVEPDAGSPHDASSCLENGAFDNDCCAVPGIATCSGGLLMTISTVDCCPAWSGGPCYEYTCRKGDREVSYRRWSAGVPAVPFKVNLPFPMPFRGETIDKVSVGRGGSFLHVLDLFETPVAVERSELLATVDLPSPFTVSVEITATGTIPQWGNIIHFTTTGNDCCEDGDRVLALYFGQQNRQLCLGITVPSGEQRFFYGVTANLPIGQPVPVQISVSPSKIEMWVKIETWERVVHADHQNGDIDGPLSDVKVYTGLSFGGSGNGKEPAHVSLRKLIVVAGVSPAPGSAESNTLQDVSESCWSSLPDLVAAPHILSERDSGSSQGSSYLSERFCSDWATYIKPNSCSESDPGCDATGNSPGNVIVDGGADMYDYGNLLVTSLMDSCQSVVGGDDCEDDQDWNSGECVSFAAAISAGHISSATYCVEGRDEYIHCQHTCGSCGVYYLGNCQLGSLGYRTDFEDIDTECFGPGGSYRMAKLGSVWVFFTHNAGDSALDFMILGNLGADNAGSVTEFVLEAPPWIGFVKSTCSTGDPTVNHLIIVDDSGGLPTHSCDYERGGACAGASSDLDDDILAGISPGSPILYLLYSSEADNCIKQDEHRSIFEMAVQCLRGDDQFQAIRGGNGQTVSTTLQLEVDVDDRGEIIFGGSAGYVGWKQNGGPSIVSGPGTAYNAIAFEGGGLQLAPQIILDTEVVAAQQCNDIPGWTDRQTPNSQEPYMACDQLGGHCSGFGGYSDAIAAACPRSCGLCDDEGVLTYLWSLTCMINVDGKKVGAAENSTLLSSADGTTIVGPEIMQALSGTSDGWRHVTMHVRCSSCNEAVGFTNETRTVFVDGLQISSETALSECDEDACNYRLLSVGARRDGTMPFPLILWKLQLFKGLVAPDLLQQEDQYEPLPYHGTDSRWISISKGLDGVDINWDTFGWQPGAREGVQVMLHPEGDITISTRANSMLWDRAVASAGGATSTATTNWTTTALNATVETALGIQISYIDSDP